MADADDSPALRADAGADWDAPIPLDDAGPTLPPFPLDALPGGLQELCGQSAAAVGCPVDYPAAHALAVAAGAVGGSYDLQVKRGYLAIPNLWVCVVAPPGSGKSPSCAPVLAPVYREQARRRHDAEATQKQLYVSDVTVEKLAEMLSDNGRGLTMIWDEMAGWLTGFNQYKGGGKGNDRAHYLSMWDGRPVKVDRKAKDSTPVFVPRPRLSVVGGIQPEVLDELRAGPSDGMFDRMLFVYPADPGLAVETFAEVDDAPCQAWEAALRTLWAKEMKPKTAADPERPWIVPLNEDARPMWQGWTRELAEMAQRRADQPFFRPLAAKISGYAARLALVVHLLREAYGEAPANGVGPDDLHRGIALATYFMGHAERVYRAAGRDKRLAGAAAVLKWATRRAVDAAKDGPEKAAEARVWTRAEAFKSLRNNGLFENKIEALDAPLKLLLAHRAVRLGAGDRAGPGRPTDGGKYELNPALANGVSGDC
jgi:hypothetical protein